MSRMSRMSRDDSKLPASTDNTPVIPVGRITVGLIDQAAGDLQATHDRTGLSKTDIVNRAITLYEFVAAELDSGAELIVRRDGNDLLIKLL
jgi:hypothetical protein